MAKRKKVNRSQAIRDYIAEHPDDTPKEVAAQLKRLGVNAQLVSNVKAKTNTTGGKRKKQRKKRRVVKQTASHDHDSIVAAAQLIRTAGGADEAKKAIEAARKVGEFLS